MMLHRRTFLMAATAAVSPLPARAQSYPSRPIRVILPSQPGSTIDVNGRYIAEKLGARLRSGVVIDNRAGAGGGIGSDAVAKSTPDGYTLLFAGTVHFTAREVPGSALSYDPVKDFVAIAKVSSGTAGLAVPADSPYRTLGEVIQAMKAKPGEITYASGGVGSTSHLAMVLFNDMTKTKARHIAYKGNSQAVTDAIGGQVAMTWQGAAGVVPMAKAGRVRVLAVTGRTRWESLPDVPTVHEAGVPGYELSSWMGMMGPAGLPASVVNVISDEMLRIARTPEYKEFCDRNGMEVDIMDHRAFQAEMPIEAQKWRRLLALAAAE